MEFGGLTRYLTLTKAVETGAVGLVAHPQDAPPAAAGAGAADGSERGRRSGGEWTVAWEHGLKPEDRSVTFILKGGGALTPGGFLKFAVLPVDPPEHGPGTGPVLGDRSKRAVLLH
jgi:hypothetical protein